MKEGYRCVCHSDVPPKEHNERERQSEQTRSAIVQRTFSQSGAAIRYCRVRPRALAAAAILLIATTSVPATDLPPTIARSERLSAQPVPQADGARGPINRFALDVINFGPT